MTARMTLVALTLLASVAIAPLRADRPQGNGMTAQAIYDRMTEVYAKCKTYRDRGTVHTTQKRDGKQFEYSTPFKIGFERTGQKLLLDHGEFSQNKRHTKYIVWADDKDIRVWWGLRPKAELGRSISIALRVADINCSGLVDMVVARLVDDELLSMISSPLIVKRRLPNAAQGGVDCYRVSGVNERKPVTLWIDTGRYLIRRADVDKDYDKFTVKRSVVFNPAIDVPLDKDDLKFAPPDTE